MFGFDIERIVRIFRGNNLDMSLTQAFEVAEIIYNAHTDRLNEVENNAFNSGKKEARSMDANRVGLIARVALWADGEFNEKDLRHPVQSIMLMRKEFPELTIPEGKAILSQCSGFGTGTEYYQNGVSLR